MILLDTNAYVAFCQGHRRVMSAIADCDGVLMSTVVLGELLFGFRNGSRYEKNMQRLKCFLAEPDVTVLPVSLITADHYGSISALLRQKGTPIPTNDVWIAAQALEVGVPLVSFDGHFQNVESIKTIDPGPA